MNFPYDIVFLLDFFGESNAEFAVFVEQGKHIAIRGGVRHRFAFSFKSWAFGDELVVDF